jgi:hypothetical protein
MYVPPGLVCLPLPDMFTAESWRDPEYSNRYAAIGLHVLSSVWVRRNWATRLQLSMGTPQLGYTSAALGYAVTGLHIHSLEWVRRNWATGPQIECGVTGLQIHRPMMRRNWATRPNALWCAVIELHINSYLYHASPLHLR